MLNSLQARAQRAAVLTVFGLSVFSLGAIPFTSGLTFTLRLVSTPPQMPGMNAGDMVIVGHGVAAGGRSRLDIDSGGGGVLPFGPGDYLLALDSSRVVVVHPATKTYSEGFSMTGAMPPEVMSQASISGVSVKVEKLGAGDSVEGRATQKLRITAEYTMGIMGQSFAIGMENNMLTADLPVAISTAGLTGGSSMASMATGPFAELYAKMVEAQKQVTGTVLRATTVTNMNGPMSMSMSQSTQLSNIKTADVDEKLFSIPDGYTKGSPSPLPSAQRN